MLQFEHHIIYIAAAMILSLLLALYVYYQDSRFRKSPRAIKTLLVALRFISLSIICLLLLKPKWIKEHKVTEKPIVVFLQDGSESLLNTSDSVLHTTKLSEILSNNVQELSTDFMVHPYTFSDTLYKGFTTDFLGSKTNISRALKNINDRYYNRNLAAIILLSDGNYNTGLNPLYITKEMNTPIYTVGLGNDSVFTDLKIANVQHNDIAYLNNKFPLQFELYSNKEEPTKTQLRVYHNSKLLREEWLTLNAEKAIEKKILLETTDVGIQYYTIVLEPIDKEKNTVNNTQEIAIEVLDNRQKVLILSGSPHPDIAAITGALSEGDNFEIIHSSIKDYTGNFEAFDLVLLHQIPSINQPNQNIISKIKGSDVPLFIIGGMQTNWEEFNQVQELISINTKYTIQEVFAVLQDNFSPFYLSDACQQFIKNCPPLITTFADIKGNAVKHSLLRQEIESIETAYELLCFGDNNERNTGILLAEGIWRWRLFDYKKNNSHANFNELIQSICQFLTLNKDKRKLRLKYPKLINQDDYFTLDAQLYNDNYQLVKQAEMTLNVQSENGIEYSYALKNYGDRYKLKLNNLPVGSYNFELSATHSNNSTALNGTFTIIPSNIERKEQVSQWDVLRMISDQSSGIYISKENINATASIVKENMKSSSLTYYSKKLSDIINQKLIFLVLLLCLFSEWAIRKSLGTH